MRRRKDQGFTLIETLIGAALLVMMIAFTLQVQTRFAQNVFTQEQHQCVTSRIIKVKKQVYALRPLADIQQTEACAALPDTETSVTVATLSGTYPPASDQDCAEVQVTISIDGKAAFTSNAYPCNY